MATSLQAFISYAREDLEAAVRLYQSVEGRQDATGVSAWLDRQRLLPGMDWETSFITYSELRWVDQGTLAGMYRGDTEGLPEVWRRQRTAPESR